MNLYRVRCDFEIIVCAVTATDARQKAQEAIREEITTLPYQNVSIGSLARFNADWESLPQGWTWNDVPYGGSTDLELKNWQSGLRY